MCRRGAWVQLTTRVTHRSILPSVCHGFFIRKETVMEHLFESCHLCPRACLANRRKGEIGYCGQTMQLSAARASLHLWEEPCLSGEAGSGTVFFSGCSLRCVYCQNHDIALGKTGKNITISRLADIFLELQQKGALNINLVTPTHFVPQIVQALKIAKASGLTLPIVYNTSGYETIQNLKLLDGLIDIYLPDCKYFSSTLSEKYSNAPDYFKVARSALAEMYRQVKDPVFDSNGILQKGMIVRHLVLPGSTADSKQIIQYLFHTFGDHIYISIMNQYTPVKVFEQFPELNRTVTEAEYNEVVDYAIHLGIENGFIQEGETCTDSFIPAFDLEGI